jgi:hypothetical protein
LELAFDKIQPPCSERATQQEMANLDVEFLLCHLRKARNSEYEFLGNPDEQQRQQPASDCLYKEQLTGRIIAIEHTRLIQEDLQARFARAIKAGAGVIMYGPKAIVPEDNARALVTAIKQKLARRQLQNTQADERILLVDNRIMGTERTYLEANPLFSPADMEGVDHAFLIASSRLFKIW